VARTGTDRGTVQSVSSDGERLETVAERADPPESRFIARFRHEGVAAGGDAARRDRQRLVIEDTRTFPGLVGTADGEAALADGILAAQSAPMVTRSGDVQAQAASFSRPDAGRPGPPQRGPAQAASAATAAAARCRRSPPLGCGQLP
jgi:hypothetical protein